MKIGKTDVELHKEAFGEGVVTVVESKIDYIDPFRYYSEYYMKEENLLKEKEHLDSVAHYSQSHRGWEVSSVTVLSFHTRCKAPNFRLVCPKKVTAYSVIESNGSELTKLPPFFQPKAEDMAVVYVVNASDFPIAQITAPNRAELNNVVNAIADIIAIVPTTLALRNLEWLEVCRAVERYTPARIVNYPANNTVIGWRP